MYLDDADHTLLGISDSEHRCTDLAATQNACVLLAAQARHRLRLFSHQLEPRLFERPDFIEALRRYATSQPRGQARILITDSASVRTQGHGLVRLAQRLPSAIELRKTDDEQAEDMADFLLADEAGYLYLPDWHDPGHAQANFNDRLRVRQLGERFDERWERGRPDPALRQLDL